MRLFTLVQLSLFLLFASQSVCAQSKLTETKQSSVTGLALPDGSKQDKRLLSVSAAKAVLEMVSKKSGATIKNTEVLSLPPVTANNFNVELLKNHLQQNGWTITPVDGEPQYLWLEHNGKTVLVYFSNDKKQTNLYFGEASNTPVVQPVNTGNTQQSTQPVQQQTTQQEQTIPQQPVYSPAQPATNGYQFTSTNFDDGWTS
ncbi:MAG: hypothetical protein KGZ74_03590, partial [Chitinophagaceae bacterium]|nr:hypothetical protein [Chitinophagaceae bacterium]